MKSLFFKSLALSLFVASVVGCNEDIGNRSLSREGGMSGGGGGTLPAKPATTYDVFKVMTNVKNDLRPFVRYLSWSQFISGSNLEASINRKLFLGETTLVAILEEARLDYREDRPCYDSAGNEVEGSVVNTGKNSICISAFRIAPRVTADNVRIEVTGLVLHELSHLLGTTEEEAQAFQEAAVERLRDFTSDERKRMARDYAFHSDNVKRSMAKLETQIRDGNSPDVLVETSKAVLEAMHEFGVDDIIVEKSLSIFDRAGNFYDAFRSMQFIYLNQYLICQSTRSDHAYWCDEYAKHFGSAEEIKALDLDIGTRPLAERERVAFQPLAIRRIHDQAGLISEVSAVSGYFGDLYWYSFSMSTGTQLPYFSHPAIESGNAMWKPWIGKYEVVSVNCTNPNIQSRMGLKGFEIFTDPTDMEQLKFKRLFDNGFATDTLANGRQDSTGYIQLSGTTDHPVKTSTRGVLWSELWSSGTYSQVTESFSSENGKLFFDSTIEYVNVKGDSHEESCRFEMKKVFEE